MNTVLILSVATSSEVTAAPPPRLRELAQLGAARRARDVVLCNCGEPRSLED